MLEYFVVANSFAAPFFSDTSKAFVPCLFTGATYEASPEKSLLAFVADYSHSCGLYSALLYADANAYHRGDEPLAKWLCNHELAKQEATKDKTGFSYLGHGPGDFEIDGERIKVSKPREGKLVPCGSADVPG